MNSSEEFEAFTAVHGALLKLDDAARVRVIRSVAMLLGLPFEPTVNQSQVDDRKPPQEQGPEPVSREPEIKPEENMFEEFAELFSAADPKTNPDKALVAGYWVQVCQGNDNFASYLLNNELKHLGHKLANVTDALSSLINSKPQQVLQIKKSGGSKQARKTYKLTKAGIDRVKAMISEQE